MNDTVIRAVHLGKKYRIGAKQVAYRTLRETMMDAMKAPVRGAHRRLRHGWRAQSQAEDIWALDDLSFEVTQGEVVGIVGRNGAGKSTLLKILSRITKPTRGYADVKGRVGSLLEVGTGFNLELTGRENIYLNGAILGMKRSEIASKFDEIVAFSGVEEFIDTPVKHYSSGMHLRLAFAVAAHLESDILLVDEILAVGDAEFQKKCLGKMDDVAATGRTVLFVSHNMGAVRSLCKRSIWIENGAAKLDGSTPGVVTAYLREYQLAPGRTEWKPHVPPRNDSLEVRAIRLLDANLEAAREIPISHDMVIEIEYRVLKKEIRPLFSLLLLDGAGSVVFSTLSNVDSNSMHGVRLAQGEYRNICRVYGNLLNEGSYAVTLLAMTVGGSDVIRIDNAIAFSAVEDGKLKGDYPGKFGGIVRPKLDWQVSQ
jgi:lipopolysaccharide transport system ATP-binding protein